MPPSHGLTGFAAIKQGAKLALIGEGGQPHRLQPVQRLAEKDKSAAAGVGLTVCQLPAGVPGICKAAKRAPGTAPAAVFCSVFRSK